MSTRAVGPGHVEGQEYVEGWRPKVIALDIDGTLVKWADGSGVTAEEITPPVYDAINRAEDRDQFDRTMREAGLRTATNVIATSVEDALGQLDVVGLPAIIRPAFTLGGQGGVPAERPGEVGAAAVVQEVGVGQPGERGGRVGGDGGPEVGVDHPQPPASGGRQPPDGSGGGGPGLPSGG